MLVDYTRSRPAPPRAPPRPGTVRVVCSILRWVWVLNQHRRLVSCVPCVSRGPSAGRTSPATQRVQRETTRGCRPESERERDRERAVVGPCGDATRVSMSVSDSARKLSRVFHSVVWLMMKRLTRVVISTRPDALTDSHSACAPSVARARTHTRSHDTHLRPQSPHDT